MAAGTVVFQKLLLIVLIFAVKKASFVSSDIIGTYLAINDYSFIQNESFIYSSLYVYKQRYGFVYRPRRSNFLQLLLLLSGDIEVCPGPILKCNICTKTIRKNQRSQNCNGCMDRFHEKCLIDKLENNGERLYCLMCNTQSNITDSDNDNNNMFERLISYIKPRGIKILHQNVNGIISKMEKLKILLGETHKNIHILGITETKLNKDIFDTEISINNYITVRKDRRSGPGGGVCIYIRDDLNWHRRYDLECHENEAIWIELFIKHSKSILVNVTYRPPESSRYLDRNFNSKFHDTITTVLAEDKEVIMSGDFNCNYHKETDQKELKNILKLNGFEQLIKTSTRTNQKTETLIDLMLTTHKQNISSSFVYEYGISDHDLTGIIRKMNCKKYEPRKIFIRNYKHFCTENYKNDLRHLPWENALEIKDLNQSWAYFKKLITNCIAHHAPMLEKKITGKDCPWLTYEIKTTIHHRDYMLRKAKRTRNDIDWADYKRLRNIATSSIRKAKANYHRTLFRDNVKNPKEFWTKIKRSYPTKEKNGTTKSFKIGETITSGKSTIANAFCSFFTEVSSTLQKGIVRIYNITWKKYCFSHLQSAVNPLKMQFKFTEVEIKDVLTILKSTKSCKSAGLDNIPPRLVKEGAEEISAPLSILLNRSLRSGIFPTLEKQAKISPIHKSDSRSSLNNYRPISVLNTFSKVIERVVYIQLTKYLENNNMLSNNQYGFRPKRSTNHAVTIIVDQIRKNMDSGVVTGAVFLDLRKAFDTVHHACLLGKTPMLWY